MMRYYLHYLLLMKKVGNTQIYEYLKIIKPAMNLILCIFLNRVKLLKTRQTFCHI